MHIRITETERMAKRREKAFRILDAAAELILRWGYDKTTVEDIARSAGIAKGTLYLYWKTREDLFNALIAREQMDLAQDVRRRIVEDPAGVTLRGIYEHSALVLLQRPLMKAVILGDINVLGKLAHREHSTAAYSERLAGFNTYLEFLQGRGLIRNDLSLAEQIYTVSAIIIGFFVVTPLMPDGITLTDEKKAALIGEAIHRTLETDQVVGAEEYELISTSFLEYFDRLIALGEQRLQQLIGES
jgi:AcrR family transcriptional regulator